MTDTLDRTVSQEVHAPARRPRRPRWRIVIGCVCLAAALAGGIALMFADGGGALDGRDALVVALALAGAELLGRGPGTFA